MDFKLLFARFLRIIIRCFGSLYFLNFCLFLASFCMVVYGLKTACFNDVYLLAKHVWRNKKMDNTLVDRMNGVLAQCTSKERTVSSRFREPTLLIPTQGCPKPILALLHTVFS
ncbi:unnamed protein product [Cuscuta epithymum]|uniref:Secreted protein n=1 Tax=Cuscuta epithymum TaxID=186058 RepID=A0AAV0CN32_9ASTE|nr:unnamed protein product [Cuscuta epithymum]